MAAQTRPGLYVLALLLAAATACPTSSLLNQAPKAAAATPQPASGAAPASPVARQPASAPAPASAPVPAAAAGELPRLQLRVSLMKEHTGGEFGLTVPMLLVTLHNVGAVPALVPPPGVNLLVSLRLVLGTAQAVEFRRVLLGKPWEVVLQPLAPGGELYQALSPLSRELRDAPLAPGSYQVGVCVIPAREAAYPSAFNQQFGGTCSNEIELLVRRRK